MWKKFKNYFLERFRQKNRTELLKAFYLLLSTITVLVLFAFLFLSHIFFWPGPIFLAGDILGIIGCLLALYAFRQGELQTAGKLLIGFMIVVFSIHSVVADIYRAPDPAIRYRLYITFSCILGTFFLFISFFRNIRQLVYFTVLFIGILTVHFLVILHQMDKLDKAPNDNTLAFYAFEHYVTVSVGVIAATVISGLLITLIERLYTQAIEQGEVIRRQNEELQETIDEQARFLMSSNESLREFAYLTSHDLREPLRSISGFITLIKKHCENIEYEHKAEVAEYFDYVHRGVRQMEELISDIKEYSAINVFEKNFSRVAMGELIYQVRNTMAEEISKTQATINIQPDMPEVTGDRTLLYSLVQNLMANAIKYHKTGQPPIVNISYTHTPEGHVFAFRDNGIGIAEEYQDRIFLAFKRLHGKQGPYSGTGLGLAICKKAVEIHDGRIWLESIVDKGSTFFFSLKD